MDLNAQQIAVAALLAAGAASTLFSAIGVLVVRDFYERIHYMAPAATLGVIAIAVAVIVEEGASIASVKAILIALVVLLLNPVLSHATARAGRIRRLEQWEPRPGEEMMGLQREKKRGQHSHEDAS
jgi:monovalent cation/proton antiporter MnhG/PhaG subunit